MRNNSAENAEKWRRVPVNDSVFPRKTFCVSKGKQSAAVEKSACLNLHKFACTNGQSRNKLRDPDCSPDSDEPPLKLINKINFSKNDHIFK